MCSGCDVGKPLLKIYGERNSGTKYLTKLTRRNLHLKILPGVFQSNQLKVEPEEVRATARQREMPEGQVKRDLFFEETFSCNLGWKHSLVKSAKCLQAYEICSENISFLTITKNPYSWLLSLFRRPYDQWWRQEVDFDTFLTSPWLTVGRENGPRTFSSPVELWNRKNASYLPLGKRFPTVNLRYEDLLANPRRAIQRVWAMASCQWKQSSFVAVDQLRPDSSAGLAFYRAYYLEEQWKEKLSPYSIGLISERLSDEMLKHFQYEKLG